MRERTLTQNRDVFRSRWDLQWVAVKFPFDFNRNDRPGVWRVLVSSSDYDCWVIHRATSSKCGTLL